MAISYKEKTLILEFLQDDVSQRKAVVFLTTSQSKDPITSDKNFKLRKSVRNKGVSLKVVKNTLLSIAFKNLPDITGPTYVAFYVDEDEGDEITTPKLIVEIIEKDFKENLTILGSVVNGEFFDSEKTIQLSKTPTKEQSLAQISGLINQIIAGIAIGTNQIPTSIARGVSELSKKIN